MGLLFYFKYITGDKFYNKMCSGEMVGYSQCRETLFCRKAKSYNKLNVSHQFYYIGRTFGTVLEKVSSYDEIVASQRRISHRSVRTMFL